MIGLTKVVLKFGGTSIQNKTGFSSAIKHIEKELEHNHKVICVVSAMGRENDHYSTDKLKSLIKNYVSKKEQDRLLSVGETISSVVFTDFLIENKVNAVSLSTKELGIITDDRYTNANIVGFESQYILKLLEDYDVIVVPGFQGITKDGEITTLGRGGSDTTAIYLGIKLDAKYIKIISDVDGIYSGDPRIIKNAYKYDTINYNQLVNITKNGSKVLHYKGALFANAFKAKIIFAHISETMSHTEVCDTNVKLFNVTSKSFYYRFTLNQSLGVPLKNIDYYLNSYYVDGTYVDEFEDYLEKNQIHYTKEPDYCKISILIDEGDSINKYAFFEDNQEELKKTLNLIHDFFYYRG